MPYCPECHAEYVYGVRYCWDCEIPLVDQLPDEEVVRERPSSPPRFVTVFEAEDSMQAQLVKTLLESNGFTCVLRGGYENTYPPLPVEIQVPEDEADEAHELLAEYEP